MVIEHGCEKQHSCEAALEPGLSPAKILCSALCQSALCCTGLLHCALVWSLLCKFALTFADQLHSVPTPWDSVFQLSQGKADLCLWGKGKICSWSWRGAGLYGQNAPPRVPDWSVLMQMRTPNPSSLIGPIGIVLIGQNRATQFGAA